MRRGAPKKKTEVKKLRHSVEVAVALRRKLHAAVSGDFLPLRFTLTAGQRHDITQAPALIVGTPRVNTLSPMLPTTRMRFVPRLSQKVPRAVIRPRKSRVEDRPYDEEVYKLRNVIENVFFID